MSLINEKIKALKPFSARKAWWSTLSDPWKKAFNEAVLLKGPITDRPDKKGFSLILDAKALRFVGPQGNNPSVSTELYDLTGLEQLYKLQLLVVTYQLVTSLRPIRQLTGMNGLFVDHNRLSSLQGIEQLKSLEKLVANHNHLSDLKPLAKLNKIKLIHCYENGLTSFEGLNKTNSKNLVELVGLPNKIDSDQLALAKSQLSTRIRTA